MKKILALLLALTLALGMTACGSAAAAKKDDGRLSIVATIFPEYDWAREVIGGAKNVELTLLLDNGVDLHSFQPTADDIITIAESDIFIYVGGESSKWVDDALAQSANKDIIVIDLLELLGDEVKAEEIVEGMEAGEEHEPDEPHTEEIENDEHVWLSLKKAQKICAGIAEALEKADPANAEDYAANAGNYISRLAALDGEYTKIVAAAAVRGNPTLVFADRFPFRYMTDDYGISYYAAFPGCSAETEASFETVAFLAGKVDELGLKSVLTLDGSDGRIAQTVVTNTKSADQSILVLDSMQSVTADEIAGGATYLSVMESNLSVLEQALR